MAKDNRNEPLWDAVTVFRMSTLHTNLTGENRLHYTCERQNTKYEVSLTAPLHKQQAKCVV